MTRNQVDYQGEPIPEFDEPIPEFDFKGEPTPRDAVLKKPKPRKKFDWEKEKRRRKYPREWPRGEGQP